MVAQKRDFKVCRMEASSCGELRPSFAGAQANMWWFRPRAA